MLPDVVFLQKVKKCVIPAFPLLVFTTHIVGDAMEHRFAESVSLRSWGGNSGVSSRKCQNVLDVSSMLHVFTSTNGEHSAHRCCLSGPPGVGDSTLRIVAASLLLDER